MAWWQAEFVKQRLLAAHPQLTVELCGLSTQGDKILDTPLSKIGGKGLFTKELDKALLEATADIAVHSVKDIPVSFPSGLCFAAVCERDDPRDALISVSASFSDLPSGAHIGTASLRRQCQLLAQRPDLTITPLRGNVNTRLAKLDAGEFDGIILSAAGMDRLDLSARIRERLSAETCLPAVGQGTIGIFCRDQDDDVQRYLLALNHADTMTLIQAERTVNQALHGGCQVPIGIHAQFEAGQVWLRALVGSPDGAHIVRAESRGEPADHLSLGHAVAEQLLAAGAGRILTDLYAS